MKKTLLIIVICLALVSSWVLLIGNKKESKTVSVDEITRRDIKDVIELSGNVSSSYIYMVSSTTGGKIDEIFVEEGDIISANNVLAKLNSDKIELELKKAQLQLDQIEKLNGNFSIPANGQADVISDFQSAEERAKLALALSQTVGLDMESFNSAFSDELIEQYEEYQSVLTSNLDPSSLSEYENSFITSNIETQTQINLASLAVTSLEDAIEDMSLKSKISGEVISVKVENGSFLAPGMPAMVVADTNNLIIEAVAFEKDMARLEEDMEVNIFLNDGSDYYYIGYISKIGSLESSVSEYQTLDVMAKITIKPDSDFSSKLGASADIEVVINQRENVLALPVDCIIEENLVFVVNDDIVNTKKVITGFTDGYFIEVISGLDEGEMVVLCPEDLNDGDKVLIE